jgi:membrane associated rhomboid family serine protease
MPPVTLALLVANVAMFLLEMAGGGGAFVSMLALWPGERFQPWQIVTYSFLHGSVTHIFFNMLALYMFGGEIERLFGSRFYAAYYFASVVAAALCHLAITFLMGGPPIPTVGASGGVFGLLLAFGMYFPHRRVMLLFPPIPMSARTFVILFGIVELVLGVTGTQAGVAHFAHLGGMLGGWLMILYRRKIRHF